MVALGGGVIPRSYFVAKPPKFIAACEIGIVRLFTIIFFDKKIIPIAIADCPMSFVKVSFQAIAKKTLRKSRLAKNFRNKGFIK